MTECLENDSKICCRICKLDDVNSLVKIQSELGEKQHLHEKIHALFRLQLQNVHFNNVAQFVCIECTLILTEFYSFAKICLLPCMLLSSLREEIKQEYMRLWPLQDYNQIKSDSGDSTRFKVNELITLLEKKIRKHFVAESSETAVDEEVDVVGPSLRQLLGVQMNDIEETKSAILEEFNKMRNSPVAMENVTVYDDSSPVVQAGASTSRGPHALLSEHLSCKICGHWDDYNKHEDPKFVCQICCAEFTSKPHLKRHETSHTGVEFIYTICKKIYTRNDNLKRHFPTHENPILRNGNNATPPFTCEHCGRNFTRQKCLKNHSVIHEDNSNFTCETCGESFMRLDHFQRHLNAHIGEKIFFCTICSEGFKTLESLRDHLSIHSETQENAGKEQIE